MGLSNPIHKYNKTRHNVGAWFVDKLAKYYNVVFKKKFLGKIGTLSVHNKNIRILIPDLFMNLNGESVFLVSRFYNIDINHILVVHDELDLTIGNFRFRQSSGHGGHNGIRSILLKFNLPCNFYKISIGIGRPLKRSDVASFVLSAPTSMEKFLINKTIDEALLYIIQLIENYKN